MADELAKVTEESARGGFFLISGTAIATVVMAVASIIIARFLGPELYGQYTLALVVPQLLFLFTDLGINQGITKFTASFRVKNETARIRRVIKYGLLLRVFTGIAIFAINYALADSFASILLQRPELAFYTRIAAISILFQVIFTTANSAFIGLDKTEFSALNTNIQAIAKATVSIGLVLLGFSVTGAILGHVIGYFVAAIAGIAILWIVIHEKTSDQNDNNFSNDLKIIIHYGIPLYISILLTGIIPLYQNIILAIFTTDADIGNYKAAVNFISLITVLTVPIATALLPAFSKLNSLSAQKIRTFYQLANKYTAMIIVPVTFLLIIFSKAIVQIIYGSTYGSAPLFLAICCLPYLLVGLGYLVLPSLYNGLGETKITLKMSLITFIILIVLSPILTKTYSVQGLIAAFIIASTASTLYGLHVARKNLQVLFATGALLKIYFNSAISTIPALIMLYFWHSPQLLKTIIGGIAYLFLYTTLIPVTRTVILIEIEKALHITRKIPFFAPIARPILLYQQRLANFRFGTQHKS
jgi:O-antigen/teichoic acid export membrane protein